MIRRVNLLKYVPYDVIGKTPEFRNFFHSEDLEFDEAWEKANFIKEAGFIFTADPSSIEYWEKMLDLPHEGDLEDRQRKVYVEWNKRIIWTHRTLIDWLDLNVGRKEYILELFYNDYGVMIDVFITKDRDTTWLYTKLRRIIPANLTIEIRVSFASRLELQTRSGDYGYPLYMCGEEICGDIPYPYFEAEATRVKLNLNTAVDDAKNPFALPGTGIKVGVVNDNEVEEILYMSDFNSEDVYSFEGSEDV